MRRFEELYATTADRIMSYCLRPAGTGEAEDAFAETFAIAWRKVHQLPDPPLPWLYVTARTTVLEHRRRNRRQGQIAGRPAALASLAAAPAEVEHERRAELLALLAALSEDAREALLLTLWDGLSTQRAADVLGISAGTLRVRIHRARTRLRSNPDLMGVRHA